eukprot:362563-Chlamydomonas_euryale.AAC.7
MDGAQGTARGSGLGVSSVRCWGERGPHKLNRPWPPPPPRQGGAGGGGRASMHAWPQLNTRSAHPHPAPEHGPACLKTLRGRTGMHAAAQLAATSTCSSAARLPLPSTATQRRGRRAQSARQQRVTQAGRGEPP